MQDRWRMRKDIAFYVWMGIVTVVMAVACSIYIANSSRLALVAIMVTPVIYMAGHFLGSYYFQQHAVSND